MPAEGDGQIVVDFDGAPATKHEDYRFHHFDKGYECNGKTVKNWLFVIPDGVGGREGDVLGSTALAAQAEAAPHAGVDARVGSPSSGTRRDGSGNSSFLNHTNLRQGNLQQISAKTAAACSQSCDGLDACKAWVFEATAERCFLKTATFCANPAADACGGCESGGPGSACPCSAGIKQGVKSISCGNPGPPAPPQPRGPGRACGRMGFGSDALNGPYTYCRWLEQPNPQGLNDPGGPESNCDSWPGDIIQSKDGSLFFVNGWGNIYKADPGTCEAVPEHACLLGRVGRPSNSDRMWYLIVERMFLFRSARGREVACEHEEERACGDDALHYLWCTTE
jgi:hypothetical protein